MIKVLVVEDSAVVRAFLVHILRSDPGIEVVGVASDGLEAVDAVRRMRPDVVTMDIHMPKLDGIEATRRIMETHPTPIVIVSGSSDPEEVTTTFAAVEAGALAVMRRPSGLGHPDHEESAGELLRIVKLMAEVKVVRRWARRSIENAAGSSMAAPGRVSAIRSVGIGASTGGPPVLQAILSALPGDFPLPILIVQHMTVGFTEGFVDWLNHSSRLRVHLAANGETLVPGHVYVAPDGFQMGIEEGERIVLTPGTARNGLCPSVSHLFRSMANLHGGDVVAGLLTGMGRDGAEELRLLKDLGAQTFVQDRESSVVHGMPGEAIRLGAASLVLPADRIAATLVTLSRRGKREDT
ncbi:MAG TPA: chemotaxis-specific protein-glutamate methyltransferase CheB [Thermoanaerobaculia bacterium]|nr:chemotaxis-specific protein-glutamate methyltransferase CheB [Thermoanaerobaculia bacterium]